MKKPDGSFVRLFLLDKCILLDPAEHDRLDAKVGAYLETQRDAVLTVEGLSGASIRFPASQVAGWCLSTPETRFRAIEQKQQRRAERSQIRASLGLFDGDE